MKPFLRILVLLLAFDPISAVAEPFVLAPGAGYSSYGDQVRVVHDGARFIAVWKREGRIESAWGNSREELAAGAVLVSPVSLFSNLALEPSPAGTLLLWTDEGSLRGSLLVGETWILLTIDYEIPPAYGLDVAWDGESFIVVWSDVGWSLRAIKLSTHGGVTDLGALVDSRPFPVTQSENFTKPRVTAFAGGFAVVAESNVVSLGGWWYETSAVFVRADEHGRVDRVIRDLLPGREINGRFPEATPVDVTFRNDIPLVVAGDGERILVIEDPGGPGESRTVIARSRAFHVTVEVLPNAHLVHWFHYGRMFTVRLDGSAMAIGPIRVVEAAAFEIHEPNSTLARWPLDIAASGGVALAVFPWRIPDLEDGPYDVAGEFFTEGEIHPTPDLAAPSPASAAMLPFEKWLVTWTAVPGATVYVVQWKFEHGGWLSHSVTGEASVEYEYTWPAHSGAPTEVRVFAMNRGLMSKPATVFGAALRTRLVRR